MNLYWIKAQGLQLAVVPRPRGGDWLLDHLKSLKQAGIKVLVSLLTAAESHELGLLEEAQCCREVGIVFLTFPIEDRSVPSSSGDFVRFTELADSKLNRSLAIGIHCRAGIGRSSLFAACLLSRHGYEPGAAFEVITQARGVPVPDTVEQRRWVEQRAESIRSSLSRFPMN
jgi:protein-tyrosine phosphatase